MKVLSDERGVAAVEFALVVGLLALLMFVIIDMGHLMSTNMIVTQAAREGARRAAIDGGDTPSARQAVLDQIILGRLDPDRLEITFSSRQARYGFPIQLDLVYQHRFFTPLLRGIGGDPYPVAATVRTRSEYLQPRPGP